MCSIIFQKSKLKTVKYNQLLSIHSKVRIRTFSPTKEGDLRHQPLLCPIALLSFNIGLWHVLPFHPYVLCIKNSDTVIYGTEI